MNGLSWLLYLAGVVGNLQGIAMAVAIPAGIFCGVSGFAAIICNFDNSLTSYQARWIKGLKTVIPVFLLASIFASVIPSRETVLLIAASETGEQIIQSDVGTEAGDLALDTLKLLRDKINDELSSDSEK